MSVSDCQCPSLIVSLNNEALAKQSERQDTYRLSEKINGKPSWKSGTQAIWYYPRYNQWIMGSISNIGTNTGGIYSFVLNTEYVCPQQVPKDKWKYYDGSKWKEVNSNDFSFQCTGTYVT